LGTDWARRYDRAAADLYSLVHEDGGLVATFTRIDEAVRELDAVLRDEPTWITRMWIEPFTLLVSDGPRPKGRSNVP